MGNLILSTAQLEQSVRDVFSNFGQTFDIANMKYEVSCQSEKQIKRQYIDSQKDYLHAVSQSGGTTSSNETKNGFILKNVDIKKNKRTGQTFTEINTIQFFLNQRGTQVRLKNITVDRINKHQQVVRKSLSFDINQLLKLKQLENVKDLMLSIRDQMLGNQFLLE